jgi:hypothetical protein
MLLHDIGGGRGVCACVCVCVCLHVRVCVRVSFLRACVRVCVCVCVCTGQTAPWRAACFRPLLMTSTAGEESGTFPTAWTLKLHLLGLLRAVAFLERNSCIFSFSFSVISRSSFLFLIGFPCCVPRVFALAHPICILCKVWSRKNCLRSAWSRNSCHW